MLDAFLPLLLILALAVLLPQSLRARPRLRPWIDWGLVIGMALILGRYLWWRLEVTVLPANEPSIQSAFVWILFGIEMMCWTDAVILVMSLMRRTNRSPEADIHEARLRGLDPADLPTVDVFVATYNEPQSVLEKTIVGALSLDWPADKLRVYVLDDGDRPWLEDYATSIGALYLTRPGSEDAKAGNINAAIARTTGDYFMVLDADFVPQQNFLYRAIGFFEDPKIGIVQIPHNFFNGDPMQSNLNMQKTLPDDQRLFFDAIMPGRDGWDCAFCCGSNSITRRTAIEAVGNRLPSGSITEDMLLTLALLRNGFVTRFLNERLAVGLAPESLMGFFVQRARWAQGALQILFLPLGPLGPGLKLHERALFLPLHWLTQTFGQITAMSTPAIYLWTGLTPLMGATTPGVLSYQLPAVVGMLTMLRLLAPGQFFPLAAAAHGVLQAFRLAPPIVATLLKPWGHKFKVTPKGGDHDLTETADWTTLGIALGLMFVTATGLLINSSFDLRIVGNGTLVPIVAFWSILNMTILSVVSTIAVSPPRLRMEERFYLQEPCGIQLEQGRFGGEIRDASLSGARIDLSQEVADPDFTVPARETWLMVDIARVGRVAAFVRRSGQQDIGVEFHLPQSPERRRLIRRLFAEGSDNSPRNDNDLTVTKEMIAMVLSARTRTVQKPAPLPDPPAWIEAAIDDMLYPMEDPTTREVEPPAETRKSA